MIINKLYNLPHILWININSCKERYNYMKSQFEFFNLKNTRIEAYNGISDDFFIYLSKPNVYQKKTFGCLCSHFKAIEYFVNNKNLGNVCLIAEDDLSIEFIKYWNKNFWDYINSIPNDYDIIQLSQIYSNMNLLNKHIDKNNMFKIKKHVLNEIWGTGIYLITRNCAENLLKKHIIKKNNKYDLLSIQSTSQNNILLADIFLYKYYNTYSSPLFTINEHLHSNIQNLPINKLPSDVMTKKCLIKLINN